MSTPENPSAREPRTPAEPGKDSEQQQGQGQEEQQQPQPQPQNAGQPWQQEPAQQPWQESPQQSWQQPGQGQRYGEQASNGHQPRPEQSGQPRPEQGQPRWGEQPPFGRQPSYTRPPTEQADANSPFGASHGAASPQNPYTQQAAGQPGQPGQPQNGQEQGGQPGYGNPPPGTQPGDPGQPDHGYPPPPPGYGEPYGAPQGSGTVPGMPPYASWGQRAVAWLIDNLIAAIGIAMTDMSYYGWGHGLRIAGWIIAVAGSIWAIYNAYQAGQTGQSTGKRYTGIRLARYVDGQVVGPAFGLLRLFMNVVFWVICFIPGVLNYLWPLWDKKSQTWSDKIASSVVVKAR